MPPIAHLSIAQIPYTDNLRLAALVEQGLPALTLQELAVALSLSLAQIATAVQIPLRTLERRVASKARLKAAESERALRLGRLFAKAGEVFGDEAAAAEWFAHPLHTLGGRSPLALCATEPGAREVEQTLGRIEHGVFS
jgi:putative toxin-antitoxin system antitoxin component (TIGR02293 family)